MTNENGPRAGATSRIAAKSENIVILKLQARRDPADFGASDLDIFIALSPLPTHQRASLAGWLYAYRQRMYGERNGAVPWASVGRGSGLHWLKLLGQGKSPGEAGSHVPAPDTT